MRMRSQLYILNLGTRCIWGVSSTFLTWVPDAYEESAPHLLSVMQWEAVFISFLSNLGLFDFYRRHPLGSTTISNVLQIIFSQYRCTNVQNWNSQDCNSGHCQNSPAKRSTTFRRLDLPPSSGVSGKWITYSNGPFKMR